VAVDPVDTPHQVTREGWVVVLLEILGEQTHQQILAVVEVEASALADREDLAAQEL